MKLPATPLLPAVASFAVLGLIPAVLAHGDEHGGGHGGGMQMGEADKLKPEDQYPPTYFALTDHRAAILGHIGLMVLSWVFLLPAAVMLSIARSRYTLLAQFAFSGLNAGGMLLGIIYNASMPDLYPNNAHHKLGWIVTVVVSSQVVVGLLARVAGMMKGWYLGSAAERQAFIPVSTAAIAEHESQFQEPYGRLSNDSGQGTEPRTESLRSHSLSSDPHSPTFPMREVNKEYEIDLDDDDSEHSEPLFNKAAKADSFAARAAEKISDRLWKVLMFGYNFVDRTILILGFTTICTGVITYGRFFEGHELFSGLAHWIKGGVFFWLGIFTLGRWAGSFGELGWAWNIRPKTAGQQWRPSAEFVESALIFFYGSTNIFLEHLANWGDEWSAQDLEHLSITVLFIGGGLCGMLIESVKIRNLHNHTVANAVQSTIDHEHEPQEREQLCEPETYSFSLNPIPALVILLLGIMMSSHTQDSMISSMVHKQWGNLLTGASFARGLTYVLIYLKPPKSIYPSRPPTELLTSFGLISGGIIFMASASSTVSGMIHYQLDAMFIYTVTMGLVALLMAWVVILVAIKGWAARREVARLGGGAHKSVANC